ncbi:MAG: CRISPR-associated protein Csx19 [Ktedonobacteraceae bacterium]
MAQVTQTEQATGELLLAGTISEEDFAAFIQAYDKNIPPNISPDAPALMLLEEQPHRVIAQDARQGLLHFAIFDPAFDFTPYTSGRIFHALGELRWERQHPSIQIVYTGHKGYKPQIQGARETALDAYIPEERAYFLFGKRLNKQERDLIGPAAQSGDFAEVRIPRLLRYPQLPTVADAERVRLVICEYTDPTTALNVAYRFKKLVRFQKQSETTGAN